MKMHAALLLAALVAGGCAKGTAVLVSVSSMQTITVDHFAVDASIGTEKRSFTVPLTTKTLPPDQTFVIDVGDKYSGDMQVVVRAESASGDPISAATGSVTLSHGSTVKLSLSLGSGNTDAGMDLGGSDGASPDLAEPCLNPMYSCTGSALVTTCANGATTSQTCTIGCSDTNGSHCKQIVPTFPVTAADVYNPAATADLTLPTGEVVFDTDDGSIFVGATVIRAANPAPTDMGADMGDYIDPTTGISFALPTITTSPQRTLAMWGFHSLTIQAGTTVNFLGDNAAALLASTTITMNGGSIDMFPYTTSDGECPRMTFGPGGQIDDNTGATAAFPGTGGLGNEGHQTISSTTYDYYGGGGGGSYGAAGGAGAYKATVNTGSQAGATYGLPTLSPLIGGSAGGWADSEGLNDSGAGGGALQLVAATSVTINGTVNAGGCGGRTSGSTGGTGGGSGGAILIESPTIQLEANGVLAVNGGGGSAAGCNAAGQNGQAGTQPAKGGLCTQGSAGGNGGSQGTPAGSSATLSAQQGVVYFGGGGGGGVGYIRLNGMYASSGNATVSPAVGTDYTTNVAISTQ